MTVPRKYFYERHSFVQNHSWLLSFTDLMALMLAFFILVYSMSSLSMDQWSQFVAGVQDQDDMQDSTRPGETDLKGIQIDRLASDRALDLDYVAGLMRALRDENLPLRQMSLERQEGLLRVSMPSDFLFQSASSALRDDGGVALVLLSDIFKQMSNQIIIAGHTDPKPIANDRYASNWGLSLMRAQSVGRLFVERGYQKPMRYIGLADGGFAQLQKDIQDGDDLYNIARRVDILILSDTATDRIQ